MQEKNVRQPYVLIVQPIVVQSDEGTNPASIALPEKLVDRAYEKAGVDFYFLEPIFYNNTKARDGLINLDQIVAAAEKDKLLKGQGDIVNMFFRCLIIIHHCHIVLLLEIYLYRQKCLNKTGLVC
jgi:hypothetical protein